MEKRSQPRLRRRMTCAIAMGSQRSIGVVRDVSPSGLFVQTSATPDPNSVVELIFPAELGRPELRVEAGVARRREVARRLQGSVPTGLGLEILPPRRDFEKRIFDVVRPAPPRATPDETSEAAPAEEAPIKAYRFRLTRHDHAESRVLTIRCQTQAGARARALARVGPGWKISALQSL